MNGFLLDTNAISELAKDALHPRVTVFLAADEELRLSTVVLHELDFGIDLLPPGVAATASVPYWLRSWRNTPIEYCRWVVRKPPKRLL